MPWRTMELREQRVRFVVAAHRREKSMAELCREFGISRPVGYEWLRRYQQGGVQALAELSRRPQHSPRHTDVLSSSRWWGCGGVIPTGERASCGCCWPSRG
jgi:transposase-like protein